MKNQQAKAVTQVAITDIADLLNPAPAGRRMPMDGFDEEFVDIADYIVRITDRIWHDGRIDLCRRYYADDGIIHTMAGDIIGATTVEANTRSTLASFPDRTLDADNVIWRDIGDGGYYTSHLITSRMTNLGPSEFGPATGRRARIRTIADCICRENKIVEEWLMRDNAALVSQLGLDLHDIASQQAQDDLENGRDLIAQFSDARQQTQAASATIANYPAPEIPENSAEGFAKHVIDRMWNQQDFGALPGLFDFRIAAHLTNGRDLYGTVEYREYCEAIGNALSDICASVDHVASIPYLGDAVDIGLRWTISATHSGDGIFGPASGAPIYILGASHWRVINGRIREEWTVFDELALLRQIESHRLRRK